MPTPDSLPFVDELSVDVAAGSDATWNAVREVVERMTSTAAGRQGTRLLGCADTGPAGPRPLAAGSTVPGFHVEAAEPPRRLALAGSHRFSEYALTFRLDGRGSERTRLRAETRAIFPGLHGRAYRALVIGTRGHVLATRRVLDSMKRRAERG
jgi:hypothetical protein